MLFAQVQDVTLLSAREILGEQKPRKRSGFAHKHHHAVVKALLKLGGDLGTG